MKPLVALILILLSFLFSCQNKEKEETLIDRAEVLSVNNPDSAYILLDSIMMPEIMSDKLLARWCMLYGRIANKLFKDMPYVSQLTRASEWYKKHGTLEEQAWIGLYLGRSYFEDQMYLQATDIYSEALVLALKGNAYNVAGYICCYTADLYKYTGQISEERRKYEEAGVYFEKAGNTRSYAFVLRDIAKTWVLDESCSLALMYMLRADSIVVNSGNLDGAGEIILELGNIYRMMGETDKARAYYFKSLSLDSIDIAATYLALSEMYFNLGDLDSARLLLDKANVKTHNKYIPASILHKQYEVEKADNNPEKALFYLEQYDSIKDSLYDNVKQADIIDAEKRYNQLLLLDENKELRISRFIFTCLLFVCIIICLLGWILYQEKNKRTARNMQEQQQVLEQKENQLRQLVAKLKEKEKENCTKEEALYEYTKEIKAIQKEISRLREEKFLSSSIVKKIKMLSSKVVVGGDKPLLTEKDWNAILKLLDTVYIGLPSFLKSKKMNFTQAELESCYLCFFNLEVREEAILLNINPESVSKRRFRIRQKLGLENTPIILSDYLISLMQPEF